MTMKKKTLGVIIVLTLFFILFYWLGWIFLLGNILKPLQSVVMGFNREFNDLTKFFLSRQNLEKENQMLKEKINQLLSENIRQKIIEKENQEIKKELKFKPQNNYDLIVVSLLGKKNEGGLTWFILDQGSEKGIKEGCPVVNQGILVGKIMKVTPGFSYLLPLLDGRSSVTAMIIPQDENLKPGFKISGLVRGRANLGLEMNYIPLDQKIKTGDSVVTSGLESLIPQGLLIGKISRVDYKPEMLFQRAIIEPIVKLENLSIVTVIIPKF